MSKVLVNFMVKLAKKQKDIPNDIKEIIGRRFWELI